MVYRCVASQALADSRNSKSKEQQNSEELFAWASSTDEGGTDAEIAAALSILEQTIRTIGQHFGVAGVEAVLADKRQEHRSQME